MALTRHRFIVLFVALVVFYALAPVLQQMRESQPGWPPILEGVLFLTLLTIAVLSILRARAGVWVAVALALPTAVLWVVNAWALSPTLAIVRQVFAAAFLIYAIGVILRYVFHSHHVTYDTVCASLCVYLLLGLVWGMLYAINEALSPGAFSFEAGRVTRPEHMGIVEGETTFLYFSFVTLTTLGYGDIVPTTPISRMLAGFEALLGQLYLVVLVSRLVGLEIAESLERRRILEQTRSEEEPDES